MMTHATALFADRHTTHAALEQLAQAGFSRDAISLVMSENTHQREFADGRPRLQRQSGVRRIGSGGVLGAIAASLAAYATLDGAPLRVGGPLQSAIVAPVTLVMALVAIGLAEPDAQAVDARVRSGAIVVGVTAPQDRVSLAVQLLELSGGSTLQAA
jgi:hypothetical protein